MIVIAVLVGMIVTIYWILTVLPTWFPTCPMVTPFTRLAGVCHSLLVQLRDPRALGIKIYNRAKKIQRAIDRFLETMRVRREILSVSAHLKSWLSKQPLECVSGFGSYRASETN